MRARGGVGGRSIDGRGVGGRTVGGRSIGGRTALVLAGVALLAFQLRSPLVALAPLAGEAQRGWGVGPAAFGLLTTLPLLCFSLSSPLAPLLARRIGLERSILVCIAGIVVATVVRAVDGFAVALVAVVVLGLAITIGNVLVPTVIQRDVPPRGRGAATGVYTVAINVGTMITSVVTVPLAAVAGWRAASAAWSVLGVLTALVWIALLRRRPAEEAGPATAFAPFRPDALAILLGLAFASQAFSYYGVTTWLPTLLADERGYSAATAGTASSVFQLAGIAGGIGVPLLALRLRPPAVLAVVGVLWISLPVGLLLAPEAFLAVSVLGGAAQGGGFAAIFTIIAESGGDGRRTTSLSAFVQSVGYLVAAAAPPLVGAVHEATGGWTAPLTVIIGSTTSFLVLGVLAATIAARRSAA